MFRYKWLRTQYDPVTNKNSILNTSDWLPSILDKILYGPLASREYDQWQWPPVVGKERDANGNLEISFSCFKPGSDTSGRGSARTAFQITPAFSSLGSAERAMSFDLDRLMGPLLPSTPSFITETAMSRMPLKSFSRTSSLDRRSADDFKQMRSGPRFIPHRMMVDSSFGPPLSFKLKEAVDQEEVGRVSKAVADGVVATMTQFFNKHDMMNGGIWYPDDYSKYLRDEMDSEMDPSFFTGYAKSEFFEKTGRFTFRLKEGKNASDAIRSFLEGPTVADCGNAIMACYYKCILDVVGDDKFNQIFNSSSGSPLIIGQDGITDESSPISIFAEFTTASKQRREGVLGKRPLQIGDECHFDGVIWHANKHPEGFHGGWNVIYIGDDVDGNQLFTAHGFKKPLTEREINQQFIELYNRERTPQDEQYVATAKNPRLYGRNTNKYLTGSYTISAEEAEKDPERFIKGFLVGSVRNLNSEALVRLKNS